MIRLTIDAAEVRQSANKVYWRVIMPASGTILAYCDNEKEALALCAFFTTLGQMTRGIP